MGSEFQASQFPETRKTAKNGKNRETKLTNYWCMPHALTGESQKLILLARLYIYTFQVLSAYSILLKGLWKLDIVGYKEVSRIQDRRERWCYVSTRRLPDLGDVVLRISLVRTTSAYFKQRQASKQ